MKRESDAGDAEWAKERGKVAFITRFGQDVPARVPAYCADEFYYPQSVNIIIEIAARSARE